MKRGILTTLILLAAALPAFGDSIGHNLRDADLVLVGVPQKDAAAEDGFDLHSLSGIEVIRGELPEGDFRILTPTRISCHIHLEDGVRTLLFLRNAGSGLDVSFPGALFIPFAARMGVVTAAGDEGSLLVEAARAQAALTTATPERKAAVLSGLMRTALRSGRERLLGSVVVDAVATPGALGRLDSGDRSRLLERFRDSEPCSRLKKSLLDALGETRPEGLTDELVRTVRSHEGVYHRDQIAAILAGTDCENAIGCLVGGFEQVPSRTARSNILYVLGRMGKGRGVPAIRSVMNVRLEGVQAAAVEALYADRSADAVTALGEIAAGNGRSDDAQAAVTRLASINTRESRGALKAIEMNSRIRVAVRAHAAESLDRLTR